MKVGVLGAGIAGLVSAYELTKNGVETVVFEKKETIGGRVPYCGAVTTEKFQPQLNKLIKELNLDVLKVPVTLKDQAFYTRESDFIGAESFIKLIFKELGVRGTVSFMKASSFVNNLDFNPQKPDPKLEKYKKISFADYLEKECSNRISSFVKDLASLFLFEDDLSNISAEYGLCHLRWGNELATGKAFGFEENNLMTVINIMAEKIKKESGEILNSAEVVSVKKQNEKFVVSYKVKGENKELEVDKVIAATPLNISQQIFPELEITHDVVYATSKCFFVEGEMKWPERKFVIGLPGNSANLRAIFNVFPYMQMIYPRDNNQPVNLNAFYNNYKIIDEEEMSPAFSVFPPNCRIPEINTSLEGIYLCGDFYRYPTLESAVVSGEEAAKHIVNLQS